MSKIRNGIFVTGLLLLFPASAAQRPTYEPFIHVCGHDIRLSDQRALDQALRRCALGTVRISSTRNSVTISFDPISMPLIGVGPGRPRRFEEMPRPR